MNRSCFSNNLILLLIFICPVFLLPLGNQSLGASNTCVIQGYVRDKSSKLPVQNVEVTSNYNNKPVKSDQTGFFKMVDMQKQIHTISASGTDIYCQPVTIDGTARDTITVYLESKPGAKITGKVTNQLDEPIPNANLHCSLDWNDYMGAQRQGRTDQKGEFTINSFDPELPIQGVSCSAPGYKSSYKQNLQFPQGQRLLTLTFQLSSTVADDTTDQRKKITLSGDVMDSYYHPIPNAAVSNNANQWGGNYKVSSTDNNGKFILKDIYLDTNNYGYPGSNPEILALFSQASGYSPAWKQMATANDTILHIVMEQGHSIAGKIVDSDGNPISRAYGYYNIVPSNIGDNRTQWMYNYNKNFTADTNGYFIVSSLPSDTCRFGFGKDGYTPISDTTFPLDRDDILITLLSSGDISGSVVDDITGKPISAFKIFINYSKATTIRNPSLNVSYEYSNRGVWFYPDDGIFSISKLSLNQPTKVSIEAEGYQRENIDPVFIKMAPLKKEDKLVFRMKKSVPVSGIVQDYNLGKGLPDVKVSALLPKNDNYGSYRYFQWTNMSYMKQQYTFVIITSDANGRFLFNNLPMKQGMLLLEKKGYARTVMYQVDFTKFITAKIYKAASITVLLNSQSGISRDSISAFLSRNEQSENVQYENQTATQDWKIIYSDLPPGNFNLSLRQKLTGTNHWIVLKEGQNYILDVTSTSNIKVTGVVRYKGAPAIQAMINSYCVDSPVMSSNSSTGPDGKYELSMAAPGKYQITFNRPYTGQGPYTQSYVMKSLTVSSGEYKLDVNLPDSSVKGILMNPKEGKPVNNIAVSAYIKKKGDENMFYMRAASHFEYATPVWSLFRTVTTNENGQFAFESMEAGDWIFAAEKERITAYLSKQYKLMTNDNRENIVFMVPDTGSADISVFDADSGIRIVPVELGCTDSTGFVFKPSYEESTMQRYLPYFIPKMSMTTTGTISFKSMPAGTFTLYARTNEHFTDSTTFEIQPGKKTSVSLNLHKSGRLAIALKEINEITEDEIVFCQTKILYAQNAKPVMQDASGLYNKTALMFAAQSRDTAYIPLPAGDYTVEVQCYYNSRKKMNYTRTPFTQTKLLKVEQGKDTLFEFSIVTLRK